MHSRTRNFSPKHEFPREGQNCNLSRESRFRISYACQRASVKLCLIISAPPPNDEPNAREYLLSAQYFRPARQNAVLLFYNTMQRQKRKILVAVVNDDTLSCGYVQALTQTVCVCGSAALQQNSVETIRRAVQHPRIHVRGIPAPDEKYQGYESIGREYIACVVHIVTVVLHPGILLVQLKL